MDEEKQTKIEHLRMLREDARDEIKRRIEQRDKYSIQLTIALGAIVAVTLSNELNRVLLVAPIVSIYFTVLILYSYQVHHILAQYLRKEIEPALAELCGTDSSKEWEIYYDKLNVPGIRRSFFLVTLWIVCILSPLYVLLFESDKADCEFTLFAVLATLSYLVAAILITKKFWGK